VGLASRLGGGDGLFLAILMLSELTLRLGDASVVILVDWVRRAPTSTIDCSHMANTVAELMDLRWVHHGRLDEANDAGNR